MVFSKPGSLGLDHFRVSTTQNNLKTESIKNHSFIRTCVRTYLSRCRILHLECDLCRPIVTPLHLPRSCLECVPWRDGGGETSAKVAQRGWLSSANGVKDGSGSESERRQTMQNDTTETGFGTNTRICFEASEDGVRDTKEKQR